MIQYPAQRAFAESMAALVGTGEDRGPNKNKITAAFKLDGSPWCCMGVSYAAKKAGIPTTVVPWTASVAVMFTFARKVGRLVPISQIQAGDILRLEFDHDSATFDHVEVATGRPVRGMVPTVGCNTRPDVHGSQHDGDGTYRRNRPIGLISQVFRPDWSAVPGQGAKKLVAAVKRPGPKAAAVVVTAAVAAGAGHVTAAPPAPKPAVVVTVSPSPSSSVAQPTGAPPSPSTVVAPPTTSVLVPVKPAPRALAKPKPTTPPVLTRVLSLGHTGGQVRTVQRALKVPATGTFDAHTKAAVVKVQRAKRLEPDGVVGPRTAAALGLRFRPA